DVRGRVGHRQRQEAGGGRGPLGAGGRRAPRRPEDPPDQLGAAAPGHVDVDEDDVGPGGGDAGGGLVHVAGRADDVDAALELAADPRPDQRMVVDDEDPDGAPAHLGFSSTRSTRAGARGTDSSTSAPSPGAERTSAVPPWRRTRAEMESATPRRSGGTAAGSKPRPRSRTNSETRSGSTSRYTSTVSTPAWRAALSAASRPAATSARPASSSGASPTRTASSRTP